MESIGPEDNIWHYDGLSAVRHHPRVEWDAHGIYLDWEVGRSGPHRWHLLEPLEARQGQRLFGLKEKGGWRLGFHRPLPDDLTAHLPKPARYGGLFDRIGLWKAAAACTVVAAAVIAFVVKLPDWVAPYVPRSWENNLGDAMIGDLGGRLCETPASKAALAKLTGQLAQGTEIRQVGIANVPMVNAVALPGGRILIFDKLIQEAKSPDELAGVLAHEIGHVHHRHTVTALVRQLGLSVVMGVSNSDAIGALNGVLAMSYSRDAERAADEYSIAALRKADISPAPTARFFHTLGGMSGGESLERASSWMASHPVSADREKAFNGSAMKGHRYRVSLDEKEWAALRNACQQDPDVDKGSFLGF